MKRQLPDTTSLNARLAQQNRRVQDYLDGVLGQLDGLIEAALAGDWEGVRRWSVQIAQSRDMPEEASILQSAEGLLAAAARADTESELKRHVMQLIAACGQARHCAKMP